MKRRGRYLWGIALVCFLALVFALGVTRDRRSNGQPVTVEIPQSLYAVAEQRTPEAFEQVLRGFKIRPRRAKLKRDEILALNTILVQMTVSAEADAITVYLPTDCDLFAAIDATMEEEPGWWVLSHRANERRAIELFSVAAFVSGRLGQE